MPNYERVTGRIVPQEEVDAARATVEAWKRDIPHGAVSSEELNLAKAVLEENRRDIPARAATYPYPSTISPHQPEITMD